MQLGSFRPLPPSLHQTTRNLLLGIGFCWKAALESTSLEAGLRVAPQFHPGLWTFTPFPPRTIH